MVQPALSRSQSYLKDTSYIKNNEGVHKIVDSFLSKLDKNNLRICLDSVEASVKLLSRQGDLRTYEVTPHGIAAFSDGTNVFDKVPLISRVASWTFSPSKNLIKDDCLKYIEYNPDIDYTKNIRGLTIFGCKSGQVTVSSNGNEIGRVPIVEGIFSIPISKKLLQTNHEVMVDCVIDATNALTKESVTTTQTDNKPDPTSWVSVSPMNENSLKEDMIKPIAQLYSHSFRKDCIKRLFTQQTSEIDRNFEKEMRQKICKSYKASLYCNSWSECKGSAVLDEKIADSSEFYKFLRLIGIHKWNEFIENTPSYPEIINFH